MKNKSLLITALVAIIGLGSCVAPKKYKELEAREKACSEELAKYKKSSSDFESMSKDLQNQYNNASRDVTKLKQDTSATGIAMRLLQRDYEQLLSQHESLENSFNKMKNLSAKETSELQIELENTNKELQRKADALLKLDEELKSKQKLLEEREKRVNELEEAIRKKDA